VLASLQISDVEPEKMCTSFVNEREVVRKWLLIDADGLVLGRVASLIANILRGKNKPCFSPHVDCGNYVIVINADKVVLTGKKLDNKKYYWHTGYPGGIKERSMRQLLDEPRSDRAVTNAVKRMMNKGPLSRRIMSKLKVYKGSEHPHEAQNPENIDITKLGAKYNRRIES
jgi:large subunit ribosomal protein L13